MVLTFFVGENTLWAQPSGPRGHRGALTKSCAREMPNFQCGPRGRRNPSPGRDGFIVPPWVTVEK